MESVVFAQWVMDTIFDDDSDEAIEQVVNIQAMFDGRFEADEPHYPYIGSMA